MNQDPSLVSIHQTAPIPCPVHQDQAVWGDHERTMEHSTTDIHSEIFVSNT